MTVRERDPLKKMTSKQNVSTAMPFAELFPTRPKRTRSDEGVKDGFKDIGHFQVPAGLEPVQSSSSAATMVPACIQFFKTYRQGKDSKAWEALAPFILAAEPTEDARYYEFSSLYGRKALTSSILGSLRKALLASSFDYTAYQAGLMKEIAKSLERTYVASETDTDDKVRFLLHTSFTAIIAKTNTLLVDKLIAWLKEGNRDAICADTEYEKYFRAYRVALTTGQSKKPHQPAVLKKT